MCAQPPALLTVRAHFRALFGGAQFHLKQVLPLCRLVEGEVYLLWEGGEKMKSQKDLAKGVKLGLKEDIKILDYYRFALHTRKSETTAVRIRHHSRYDLTSHRFYYFAY